MRTSSILTFLLLFAAVVNAQTNYCGTPKEDLETLKQQVYQVKQQEKAHKQRGLKDTTYYIPLKAHIVGKDDGTGYYSISTLFQAMCNLNEQMEPTNMYFYLKGEVDYIDNSDFYQHGYQNGALMMSQNNVADAANVYFVDDPNGACGYFLSSANGVAINNTCAGPDNATIAHELGHFFGLPHTFYEWEGTDIRDGGSIAQSNQELVDGSNCNSTADGFCDTPPDYFSFRWACPESFRPTDPNGDTINPDESLIMSYSLDNCQQRFSSSQKDYMINSSLLSQRQNLLSNYEPSTDSIGTVKVISPKNGQGGVAPGNATLKWEAAENATHYYLETFGNAANIQAVTTDTFYKANLEPKEKYYWKVLPFSDGNTCAEVSGVKNFNTADTCLSTSVDSSNNVYYVNVNGGTPPYSFEWSNGDIDSLLITNSPGTYTVTVSDDNNCVATEKVTIQKETGVGSAFNKNSGNNVTIYPNPIASGDQINLSFAETLEGKGQVGLYSVEGKRIRTIHQNFQNTDQLSISTDQLSEGMYIIRIRSASQSTSKKVILH
ncbi:MAG: hypothetical protein BRD50_08030 [Bacteroidetes bacterium SW_11_45_7]|nr:MAG: hypothetical protein BRD50_08030 [Bacteroidetes bacterium SW_11_45_7]